MTQPPQVTGHSSEDEEHFWALATYTQNNWQARRLARVRALERAHAGTSGGTWLPFLIPLGYLCGYLPGLVLSLVGYARCRQDRALSGVRPRDYGVYWLFLFVVGGGLPACGGLWLLAQVLRHASVR